MRMKEELGNRVGCFYCIVIVLLIFNGSDLLQGQPAGAEAKTRAEQIELARRDRVTRLWPERESPMVKQANKLLERGFKEGAGSGKGANGPQILLGGMRAGQGTAFGFGYRRSDLFRDHLGFRVTGRGTFQKAYMFDLEVTSPELQSDHFRFGFYTKYENSPQMDFYGLGPDSEEENRTSYRFEDFFADLRMSLDLFRYFRINAHGGSLHVNTGQGQRKGYPSIEEVYPPESTPGLAQQTDFWQLGGSLQFDYRDFPGDPRGGGNYLVGVTQYWDRKLDVHTFRNLDLMAEQYIPYFNRTQVLVLRAQTRMAWANEGQEVSFYMMPVLGGNHFLRGFTWYRFRDVNSLILTAEHRWHVFSGGHAALFVDAGKVVHERSDINFQDLEVIGGFGLRFQMESRVFMRIEVAGSREGFRLIWTFDNVF